MGDPRKLRKKYEVPQQIWDDARIAEEGGMVQEYGLKNVREVWTAKAELRKIRTQYKNMLALGEKAADKKAALLQRTINLGYCKPAASVDDILSLTTRDILERRIQTIVFRNGLAKSVKQASQLITHGFISLDGRKVKSPSYQVPVSIQDKIGYYKPITIDVSAPSASEKKMQETIEAIDAPTAPAAPEKAENKAPDGKAEKAPGEKAAKPHAAKPKPSKE
ncbi:30S ribosomal protein S4 [uncultured archaeon]|nr:30S ribosomal protein S4 [uncultured archaeon]